MRVLLSRIYGLLRGVVAPTGVERDLDDEVRFHVDMLVEEHVRRGLARADARALALRSFGGITQMKEIYRDQRSLPWLEMFVQDVRYGARTLRRAPGFTFAALLTLALGIGANSAIFSVVNAVLLRPLPYPAPDRIVQLVRRYPGEEGVRQSGRRYLFFREHLRSVDALAAYRGAGSVNAVVGDRAEFVNVLEVSREYFAVFGVPPALGQPFSQEHDSVGGADVAILTHAFWRRHFGADGEAIGRTLVLAEKPHVVIGVMPPTFDPLSPVDVLLPLRPRTTGPGGGFNYAVAGRLRAGVSGEQASAEAGSVWRTYQSEFPAGIHRSELPSGFTPLQQILARPIRPQLLIMFGAVGLLLLIACANMANLLLARAVGRGREIAVRAALGAARGRLVRQMLTESVVLSLMGACLGLLLAWLAMPALLAMTPPGFLPTEKVRIDATVLSVTMALALATGALFGLAPALSLSRHDIVDAFKDDSVRGTSSKRSGRLRATLVVVEVALSMVLLVAAGLLLTTFIRLRAVDPGFDPRGVLTARMSLQGERYSDPGTLNRFYDEGLERIRKIPGVTAAAVVNGIPIDPALNVAVDVLDGPERVERALTDWRYATADYFTTMRIPIVAGRGFTEADRAGAPPIVVVSEEFARRFLKGVNPVGHHVRVYDADGSIEIVGIAKDLVEGSLRGRRIAVMYVPVAQTHAAALRTTHGYFHVNWIVRADNPGPELIRQIDEQVRSIDPKQPFAVFRTMDEVKSRATALEQFQVILLGTFAGIGLLLACAGVYGLMAYSVAQRTREFGIRLALGATRHRIVGSVLREAAAMALGGVVAGAAGAAALSRVLQNFVWGVSPLDARTYVTVGLILLVVASAASLVPVLRAVRLNPLRALRE